MLATRETLWAGLAFGLGGLLGGAFVITNGRVSTLGQSWVEFPAYVAAGAFLAALLLWRPFVAKPGKATAGRGAVVGLAVGVLVHPCTWYVLICVNWVLVSLGYRAHSAGGQPIDPLLGLAAVWLYSLPSLLVAGWLSLPLGLLVGASVGRWQQRDRVDAPRPLPVPPGA